MTDAKGQPKLGTPGRPLRVAVVGAGPSGFYAAGALIQQKDLEVRVDIFDRLPAPYGLVRYGVAPDHQKIKNVEKVYRKTAEDARVRFFGNVEFGRDLNREELLSHYDRVIYAVGAQVDRRLGIPGEDLEGSFSATEFVAWYNGHPDYVDRTFDLTQEQVAVVGVGNVAMDVTRILARSVEELAATDIADHALEGLRHSRVRDIYVLARRGPAQAAFTPPEIKEIGQLEHADVFVRPEELELDVHSARQVEEDAQAARNMEILREIAARRPEGKPRRVHFRFFVSPVELVGREDRVEQMRIETNRLEATEGGYLKAVGTGQIETLPMGLVFRSVGYSMVPLPGVPFDERRKVIPNDRGRVLDPKAGRPIPREYVVGWAKRGPTGLIGTNKGDALETVRCLIEDLAPLPSEPDGPQPCDVTEPLHRRGCRWVTFEEWLRLDEIEVGKGQSRGRPRVKLVRVQEMLDLLERS